MATLIRAAGLCLAVAVFAGCSRPKEPERSVGVDEPHTEIQVQPPTIDQAELAARRATLSKQLDSLIAAPAPASSAWDRDIFYDGDGLIVHRQPGGANDGGDTSQREGWYWFGVWLRQNVAGLSPWDKQRTLTFEQVVAQLEPKHDGVFYRHPRQPPFNNPRGKEFGTSRDQLIPVIAAMGVRGDTDGLRRLWEALPEDGLGKHAFNGNWRNLLGQDGTDCDEINRRGCDATKDCSLKTDNTDCSLKEDTTDCGTPVDTQGCNRCVLWRPGPPFSDGGCAQTANDPVCEATKAANNAAARAACEARKGAINAGYVAEKNACEARKTSINVGYKIEHDACEAAKTTAKATCEAQKAIDTAACRASNVHSGDLFGPAAVMLFRRALNENPVVPVSGQIKLPPASVATQHLGDAELLANAALRIDAGSKDKNDTGDDLNLLVSLMMATLRFPSADSTAALQLYLCGRPHSFGSFFGAYRGRFGDDGTDIVGRMKNGVEKEGWTPDATPPVGAVRWYHRPDSGANPQLSHLYEPIINRWLYSQSICKS